MPASRVVQTSLAALSFVTLACPSWGEELSVNGVTLGYTATGSGSAVIFVHGAISDSRVWEPYRKAVSKEHRFVTYDQRYFGPHDWPDAGGNFSADTHAADLIAVVEELGAAPAGLVGWSYGGDVAVRAAIARPDLFSAIVLYEPDIYGLIDGLPGASAAVRSYYAGFGPAFAAIEAGRLEDASLRFIDAVFDLPEGGADAEPELWQRVWRENGRTIPPYLEAPAGDTATCADLSELKVPMLVVKGTASTVYDVMMAEQSAKCAANAVAVSMQDANHDGPYRKTDRFADMVLDFVNLSE